MARQDANDALLGTSFLYGGNADYIEELYATYTRDPNAVDPEWRSFFSSLKTERTRRTRYVTRDAARSDVFDYIEASTDGFRILVRDSPVSATTGNFASLILDVATQVEYLLEREFAERKLTGESRTRMRKPSVDASM